METNKFFTLETEQRNRFIQVPEQFMNEKSKYFKMRALTKLLYGVLAKRNSLSVKNNWHDKEGRIYFKFKQQELCTKLGIKDTKTLRKHFEELENFGLLYRERVGLKQADRLYLLQLDYEDIDYTYDVENDTKNDVKTKEVSVKNSVGSKQNSLKGKNSLSRRGKIPH